MKYEDGRLTDLLIKYTSCQMGARKCERLSAKALSAIAVLDGSKQYGRSAAIYEYIERLMRAYDEFEDARSELDGQLELQETMESLSEMKGVFAKLPGVVRTFWNSSRRTF